jgi:signal transduction histidine kinase/ligand-binding sensor domain-containing protein/DNA-binding response OmpR family regulator
MKTVRFKDMKMTACLIKACLILVLCPFTHLLGQYEEYRFSHLTVNDGLSQSNVVSILQDSRGFMWFGTFNGLNRYDGYNFEIFQHQLEDQYSISHNFISSIYEDHTNIVWVGTPDGLNYYDRSSNRFISFMHDPHNPESISDNSIEVIFEDSQNRLWIGTGFGGLNRYDRELGKFIHYIHDARDEKSISSNFVREIFEDSKGNVWVGHGNGAIDILPDGDSTFIPLDIHGSKLTEYRITGIIESEDKSIFITTQGDGLFQIEYNGAKANIINHFLKELNQPNTISSNILLDICIGEIGKLWIATEDNGLNILNPETGEFQYIRADPFMPSSLNYNSIWTIYKDRLGIIWLGTYAGGVNVYTGMKNYFRHFKHYPGHDNSLSNNMVNAFWEEDDSKIWIATDGGGLNLMDWGQNEFTYYKTSNSNIGSNVIVSLFEDRRNRLWIGTWGDGLYHFDRNRNQFIRYSREQHGLGSNNILHIREDSNGGLWLATFWGGLTYFNPQTGTVKVYTVQNSGLSNDDVRVIFFDVQGHLWVASDVGIDLFNPETEIFKTYQHDETDKNSISKGFVHSILETADATIWVGTAGGLNKYNHDTDSFIHYTKKDGLPDNTVKSMLEDEAGNIWIGTNKGISRFNPKEGLFKNFDISDGLQGNEFNTMSCYRTSNGDIFFGGTNGFNMFRLEDFEDNQFIPPVVITDFKIFNKPVPVGENNSPLSSHISESKELILSYKHSVFSFEFVALNYVLPEKNEFAYMMEGFDPGWNYVGGVRSATYTNLDPGNYTFRVKASNNDGIWNEEGTSIHIRINPPFWKTWWAYLIQFLLLCSIILFVISYFVGRQKLRTALKIEHLELENMYELDRKKMQFFNNISHEFNSPITLILDPLEKLIKSTKVEKRVKSSLALIYRNASRLKRMIDQLKDFHSIETGSLKLQLSKGDIIQFIGNIADSFDEYAEVRKIQYEFRSDHECYFAWFDSDKLDKILYNILSNAFKFTPENGEVNVSVSIMPSQRLNTDMYKAEKYIEIIIKDSGIGIPKEKRDDIFKRFNHLDEYKGRQFDGSGIGLAFAHELIVLYKGHIDFVSEEGEGTEFIVRIPVDEQFLEENQLVSEFTVVPVDDHAISYQSDSVNRTDDSDGGGQKQTQTQNLPVLLIIDDDREVRKYIKDSLDLKYRIIEAEDGTDGIKKAKAVIPDLIISDIKMPGIAGIDLCTRLKQSIKTSHIPIIILTAYSSSEYKMKGLQEGVDAFITKPFSIDILEAQIVNLLNTRGKLMDTFRREFVFEPKKIVLKDLDAKFLKQIIEKIKEHISDPEFNSEVLAKEIGLSRMQLYRKIRGLTDQTVHEFIRSIRLEHAVNLLEDGKMTITEVAYEVGFNDLTYFARCFRKQYDKSPSEYISSKKKK